VILAIEPQMDRMQSEALLHEWHRALERSRDWEAG
jgi:glycerol kinase